MRRAGRCGSRSARPAATSTTRPSSPSCSTTAPRTRTPCTTRRTSAATPRISRAVSWRNYALRGRFVVDVGCGRGDFLALVCRLGGNRGRGYDRSCPPDAAAIAEGLDVTFVPEFFSPTIVLPPIDLLCCRQVLEHIADPAAFLAEIVASPAVTGDTILFFEVPNAAYTFEDDGIWDLIYEHCSYFTASSLVALFERCGLEVIATRELYSGQYLGIEARPARDARAVRAGRLAPAETPAAPFAERFRTKLSRWRMPSPGGPRTATGS